MTITTFSSREFNQDTGRAKRASAKGPVFITYRGRPAYVLLSFEEYRRLSVQPLNIVEALSMTGLADIAFEPPKLGPVRSSGRPFVNFLLDTNVISEFRKAPSRTASHEK